MKGCSVTLVKHDKSYDVLSNSNQTYRRRRWYWANLSDIGSFPEK